MTIFNPLTNAKSFEQDQAEHPLTSESSLMNDVQGVCPKCKNPFGTATVEGAQVYYCVNCRVSQPIPA